MNKLTGAEKGVFGFGCVILLGWLVFWAGVIYAAIHFIRKFW